jgi:hypothetical protein
MSPPGGNAIVKLVQRTDVSSSIHELASVLWIHRETGRMADDSHPGSRLKGVIRTLAVVFWQLVERKTGFEPAIRALRTLRVRDGGLDLLRRAA